MPDTKATNKGPSVEQKPVLDDLVDGLLSESVSDMKRSSKASFRQEEEIDQIIEKARKSA